MLGTLYLRGQDRHRLFLPRRSLPRRLLLLFSPASKQTDRGTYLHLLPSRHRQHPRGHGLLDLRLRLHLMGRVCLDCWDRPQSRKAQYQDLRQTHRSSRRVRGRPCQEYLRRRHDLLAKC